MAFILVLPDIPAMQIIATTLVFLVLNSLLWYLRPNGSVWLLASIVLGVIWGAIFMKLIMNKAAREVS